MTAAPEPAVTLHTAELPQRGAKAAPVMTWAPCGPGFAPAVGVLAIETDRVACRYRVEEFTPGEPGRAFMLIKLDPGSDAEELEYAVLCAADPRRDLCSGCKGFLRYGFCKHHSAVRLILTKGWL